MRPGGERPPEPAGRRRGLYVLGGLTAGVYLLTCLFYAGGAESHTRTGRELFAWFLVLTLLPLFYKGYREVAGAGGGRVAPLIVGFAALFCLFAFLTVPFHSTDVFGYINRGWQQVHYHLNPYVYRLADTPGWREDPMLREHWVYNPNPYGFLFALVARLLCQAGGGNWWLTLALFKALNVAAYALTAWLVWDGARRLGHDRPHVALYSLLWNPLVLMHHVANGHNDLLVGGLVALALYLAVRGAHVWIIPALAAATMLKYGPALLVPVALVFVFKNAGWRKAALGCLLGALVCVLSAAPYLKDWRQLRLEDIRDNATLLDNSLHAFAVHLYGTVAGLAPNLLGSDVTAEAPVGYVLRAALVVFFAGVLARSLRQSSARSFVENSVLLLFALICVASSKLNGWYLGMLLAPALLLGEGHWLRRLVLLISCAQLLSLTFFKQAYMLNFFAMVFVPAWIVFRQVRGGRAAARPDLEYSLGRAHRD